MLLRCNGYCEVFLNVGWSAVCNCMHVSLSVCQCCFYVRMSVERKPALSRIYIYLVACTYLLKRTNV